MREALALPGRHPRYKLMWADELLALLGAASGLRGAMLSQEDLERAAAAVARALAEA